MIQKTILRIIILTFLTLTSCKSISDPIYPYVPYIIFNSYSNYENMNISSTNVDGTIQLRLTNSPGYLLRVIKLFLHLTGMGLFKYLRFLLMEAT